MKRLLLSLLLASLSLVLSLSIASAHSASYDHYQYMPSYVSYHSYNVRYIDTHSYRPYPYTGRYFDHYSLENKYNKPFVHYIASPNGDYYQKYIYSSTPYKYRTQVIGYYEEPIYYWPYE